MFRTINLKNPTELSGFYAIYHGSTFNEKPGNYGISHLMEHLVCKNFKKKYDEFDADGVDWNAYTSDKQIVFYLTGLEEFVSKHRDEYLDLLLNNFKITQEELDTEKKIVVKEYNKCFNSQENCHFENLARRIYGDYSPIGRKEDILNTTLEDCYKYFEYQYKQPHAIVNVSKDYEFNYDNYAEPMNFQIRSRLKEPNRDFETFNTFEKDTTVIHVSDLFEDNYVEHYIISDILGGGLNSPLYQEIREKRGLAYSISSWVQEEGFKQHAFGISSQTEKQNADEMQDCIQEVIKNPKKYLTKERYDIVIKSVHINLKKSEISRYKNIGRFISPKERDIKLKIDDVTYDKLLDCYEKTIQNHDFYKSVDQEGTKEGIYLYS